MGATESVPIINPNHQEHIVIPILRTIEFQETFKFELTDQAKNFFEQQRENKIKLLMIAGRPGIGKSTLANLICKHYIYPQYEGIFPQIFKSGEGPFNITLLFDILLRPIEINNEKYYLVDAEAFGGVFKEEQNPKRKELMNKLFSLMFCLSDICILNFDSILEKNDISIVDKLIQESSNLMKLEIGKDCISKEKITINNDLILFLRNKENLQKEEQIYFLEKGYRQAYAIKEVPTSFRNDNNFVKDVKMNNCLSSLDYAFTHILNSCKRKGNKKRNVFFDLNRFKLHLNIINEGMDMDELTLLYAPTSRNYFYFREKDDNHEGYPDVFTKKSEYFYKSFIFRILLNNTDAVSKSKLDFDKLIKIRNKALSCYEDCEMRYPLEDFYYSSSVDDSIEKVISRNFNSTNLLNIIDQILAKYQTEIIPFNYFVCYELDINPEVVEKNISESFKNKNYGTDFWFNLIIINCCLFSQSANLSYKKIGDLINKYLNWAENWMLANSFKIEDFEVLLPKIKSTLKAIFKRSYTLENHKISETLLSIQKAENKELDGMFIKINQDIIEKISEKSGQVRIITLAGKPGIGRSTLLNALVYSSKYKNHDGVYPQSFSTSSSIFSETIGIKINFTEIEVGDFEKVMLIDAEGFGAIRRNEDIDDNFYIRTLEKIYSVLMILSDSFILFLENRYEQSNTDLAQRIINIGKSIERSRTGLQNIEEINLDNFFVFKQNSQSINENDERNIWRIINRNINDFIFPIIEIPESFRKTYRSSDLISSKYSNHLKKTFSMITNQLKNKEFKFNLQDLMTYVEILNKDDDNIEFHKFLRFKFLGDQIKKESEEILKELLEKYSSIVNQYNTNVFFEEIVKELSDKLARDEIESQEVRDKMSETLCDSKNSSNSIDPQSYVGVSSNMTENHEFVKDLSDFSGIKTNESIAQIRPQNKAVVDDMLSFHNQEIKSFQRVIRTDCHTGLLANLKNGESFLVHKSNNGNVAATDAFGLSNKWKMNGKIENINNLKMTDMIKKGQQDNYLNNDNINRKEYEVLQKDNNMINANINQNPYISLSAASGYLGSLLTNYILAQYKNKSGWTIITSDLAVGAGITGAMLLGSTKIPGFNLIISGVALTVQTVNSLANKNVKLSGRLEDMTKNALSLGLGVGASIAGAELGATFGTFLGPGGTFVGGLVGALVGGLSGSLVGLGINKIWKIVDPDKAMNILEEKLNHYGYWNEINNIFEVLKINYDNFIEKRPIFFDAFLNYGQEPYESLNEDIIWGNVILLNVLSVLCSFNPEEYSERSEIIASRVLKFLKCLNTRDFNISTLQTQNNFDYINDRKLIIKDHLDSINEVIGSWTDMAK